MLLYKVIFFSLCRFRLGMGLKLQMGVRCIYITLVFVLFFSQTITFLDEKKSVCLSDESCFLLFKIIPESPILFHFYLGFRHIHTYQITLYLQYFLKESSRNHWAQISLKAALVLSMNYST